MESHGGYYGQTGLYPREGYCSGSSVGGYHTPHHSPPACIYARQSPQGGFGGQTMSVVEQCHLQSESASPLGHQLPSPPMQGPPGAINNPVPAHMSGGALTPSGVASPPAQPPPAHSQPLQPTSAPSSLSPGGGQGSQAPLQFPWMKTTKSHAHQWKAQWPGRSLHDVMVTRPPGMSHCHLARTLTSSLGIFPVPLSGEDRLSMHVLAEK